MICRLGQGEQVVVAALVARAAAAFAMRMARRGVGLVVAVGEALAAIGGFIEFVLLDHGAHRAIDDEDAFGQQALQRSARAG